MRNHRKVSHPPSRLGARSEVFARKARGTIAAGAMAAMTAVAGFSSGAEGAQIRIVHLDCKQWRARQALLADRAAHPVAHAPVGRAQVGRSHLGHGSRVRVHYVCDCHDGTGPGDAAEDADLLGGGALPGAPGGASGGFVPFGAGWGEGGGGYALAGGGLSGFGGGFGGVAPFFPGGSSSGAATSGGASSPEGSSAADDPVTPLDPAPSPLPDPPDPKPPPAIPEPSTWALLGLGAVALAVLMRRRRRAVLALAA